MLSSKDLMVESNQQIVTYITTLVMEAMPLKQLADLARQKFTTTQRKRKRKKVIYAHVRCLHVVKPIDDTKLKLGQSTTFENARVPSQNGLGISMHPAEKQCKLRKARIPHRRLQVNNRTLTRPKEIHLGQHEVLFRRGRSSVIDSQ